MPVSKAEEQLPFYGKTVETKPPRRVSLEAYFRVEEKSLYKNEFHDGVIKPMAGGSFNHDNLAQKASMLLNVFVEENELKYFVNSSDLKIRIESFNKIVYADALVICDAPIFFENRNDIILNPLIVVEVLSDSTKKHDQNVKFEMYQSLPSFKEYVLVHQDRHHVSVFTKQTDETWLLKDYDGEDATAILHHLHDCPLSLKRLYRGLELTK